jgi:HAD superfamily hydrolase (TIGR01509 family)
MATDRIILWDADGVLFHSQDAKGAFIWAGTIERDLGITYAQTQKIFVPAWHDVLRGDLATRQHVTNVFAEQNISVPVDIFIDYWLDRDTRLNADVVRFLTPENSHIATNQDPLRAQRIGQLLKDRIGKVFASSTIKALKPEATYYEFIEKSLGLAPERLCLIDDHLPNVEAAQMLGWSAHHFMDAARLAAFLND